MDGPVLFSDLIARFAGFAGFAGFALNMLWISKSHCALCALRIVSCIRAAWLWILKLQIKSNISWDVSLQSSVCQCADMWRLSGVNIGLWRYWFTGLCHRCGRAASPGLILLLNQWGSCWTLQSLRGFYCMDSFERCFEAKGTHHDPSSQFFSILKLFSSLFSACLCLLKPGDFHDLPCEVHTQSHPASICPGGMKKPSETKVRRCVLVCPPKRSHFRHLPTHTDWIWLTRHL